MTERVIEPAAAEEAAHHFRSTFKRLQNEVRRLIVGQEDVVESVIVAMACGGHVLLEGVPGLGKTVLVNTIARALDLRFQRIQFTPDLLPSDIVGSNVISERSGRKEFEFQPGPVFCNMLLADEINRATPKTQSALLETMQERSVTVSGRTHPLEPPFFVLATQNPIEHDGTYPLPEAQLDRFFFKLFVGMPNHDEFGLILERTGGSAQPEIRPVAHGEDLNRMGRTIRDVPIERSIRDELIRLVLRTHPEDADAPDEIRRYVRHGASPRAAQAILAAARAKALLDGRYHVAREDVRAVAAHALCHRLVLSFEAEAEGIAPSSLVALVVSTLA